MGRFIRCVTTTHPGSFLSQVVLCRTEVAWHICRHAVSRVINQDELSYESRGAVAIGRRTRLQGGREEEKRGDRRREPQDLIFILYDIFWVFPCSNSFGSEMWVRRERLERDD